jgi:hypothetical protein
VENITRNIKKIPRNAKRLLGVGCGRSDHVYIDNSQCAVTSRARAILRLDDGILTPQRMAKAKKELLKIIAGAEKVYSLDFKREKAVQAVGKAYDTMLGLEYGKLDVLRARAERQTDLEVHAETIWKTYQQDKRRMEKTYERGGFTPLVFRAEGRTQYRSQLQRVLQVWNPENVQRKRIEPLAEYVENTC